MGFVKGVAVGGKNRIALSHHLYPFRHCRPLIVAGRARGAFRPAGALIYVMYVDMQAYAPYVNSYTRCM
jgi:hypothetical protein